MLARRYGRDAARALMLAMTGSVDEVARICQEEGMDAHFHKGGILTLARGEHHLPMLRSAFEAYSRLGLGEGYRLCSASEAQERVCVTNVCGALYASENASVHPGRLVRGLARASKSVGASFTSTPRSWILKGDLRRVC